MKNKAKKNNKVFQPGIVWIHGASGQGDRLLVQQYSGAGHKIILSGFDRELLYELKASCKGNPMNIHILIMHSQEAGELLEKTKQALRIFGRIDTFVLCHPPTARPGSEDSGILETRLQMERIFWPQVTLIQAVMPILKRQKSGHIIVMGSVMGKAGLAGKAAQSAAHHALLGYIESLRAEQNEPVYVSYVSAKLSEQKQAAALLKQLRKVPAELTLDPAERSLLRLRFFRQKAFFKRLKTWKKPEFSEDSAP